MANSWQLPLSAVSNLSCDCAFAYSKGLRVLHSKIYNQRISVSLHVPPLPSHRTEESQTRHPYNLVLILRSNIHLLLTNPQLIAMFLISGRPVLDIMIIFLLIFAFLPFILASPCSTHPPNNAFTHTDLLSTPGPFVEVVSSLLSGAPLQQPWAPGSATTITPIQPAADAPTGHVPSIPTQDPSPFYHDHPASWRSEDITNILLGALTALAALLALVIKYIFIPLCARGQQSGMYQVIVKR